MGLAINQEGQSGPAIGTILALIVLSKCTSGIGKLHAIISKNIVENINDAQENLRQLISHCLETGFSQSTNWRSLGRIFGIRFYKIQLMQAIKVNDFSKVRIIFGILFNRS